MQQYTFKELFSKVSEEGQKFSIPDTNYTVRQPYHFEKVKVFGEKRHIKFYDFLFIEQDEKRHIAGFFDDLFSINDNYTGDGLYIEAPAKQEEVTFYFKEDSLTFTFQPEKKETKTKSDEFHFDI